MVQGLLVLETYDFLELANSDTLALEALEDLFDPLEANGTSTCTLTLSSNSTVVVQADGQSNCVLSSLETNQRSLISEIKQVINNNSAIKLFITVNDDNTLSDHGYGEYTVNLSGSHVTTLVNSVYSMSFDGSSGTWNVGDEDDFTLGTSAFTLISYSKLPDTTAQTMLGKSYSSDQNEYVWWAPGTNNRMQLSMLNNGTIDVYGVLYKDNVIDYTTYHQYAVTAPDGIALSSVKFYKDDSEETGLTIAGTAPSPGMINTTSNCGGYHAYNSGTYSYYYKGDFIAQLLVKEELSSQDISDIYDIFYEYSTSVVIENSFVSVDNVIGQSSGSMILSSPPFPMNATGTGSASLILTINPSLVSMDVLGQASANLILEDIHTLQIDVIGTSNASLDMYTNSTLELTATGLAYSTLIGSFASIFDLEAIGQSSVGMILSLENVSIIDVEILSYSNVLLTINANYSIIMDALGQASASISLESSFDVLNIIDVVATSSIFCDISADYTMLIDIYGTSNAFMRLRSQYKDKGITLDCYNKNTLILDVKT